MVALVQNIKIYTSFKPYTSISINITKSIHMLNSSIQKRTHLYIRKPIYVWATHQSVVHR